MGRKVKQSQDSQRSLDLGEAGDRALVVRAVARAKAKGHHVGSVFAAEKTGQEVILHYLFGTAIVLPLEEVLPQEQEPGGKQGRSKTRKRRKKDAPNDDES